MDSGIFRGNIEVKWLRLILMTITQPYSLGGMKMVNLKNYFKARKIAWLKRLISKAESQWTLLFEDTICQIKSLTNFGILWYSRLAHETKNPFWKDVLLSYIDIYKYQQLKYKEQILHSALWYNPLISPEPLFIRSWYKAGIYTVSDILNNEFQMIDLNTVQDKYNITINWLDYARVKNSLKLFLRNHITQEIDIPELDIRPFIPHHLKILCKPNSNSQLFYRILNINQNLNIQISAKQRWERDLSVTINEQAWNSIFRLTNNFVHDNHLKWFQYRILHRILGIKKLLHEMQITGDNLCGLCNEYPETILHLFTECNKSKKIWETIKKWVFDTINKHLTFSPFTIIF